MTIPNTFDFSPPEELNEEKLYRNLNDMYETIATGVNGTKRASWNNDSFQFTPTLLGSSTEGTFTYTTQSSQVLRVGSAVDFWYHIAWSSAGSAAGNLQIKLPYKSILSSGTPFVGCCYVQNINIGTNVSTFTSIESSSFTATVTQMAPNGANAALTVPNSGDIKGFMRYITFNEGGD